MRKAAAIPPAKKQIAASQLLTASWSVPLMPWPLVQPPAQRAPNPSRIPPQKATATRATGPGPKVPAQRDGTQSLSLIHI